MTDYAGDDKPILDRLRRMYYLVDLAYEISI